MLMQLLLASLDEVRPNPWNPNRMDTRHFDAEVASILSFGFVDPVTVRESPEAGLLEIVDGEHRYRAMVHIADGVVEGRYRIADDATYDEVVGWRRPGGAPLADDEAVPTLARYLRDRVIPAVSLGRVSESEARRLTLVLNETRGSATRSDVARLLDEIESMVGLETALRGLPIDMTEGEDLLDLARYDPASESEAQAGKGRDRDEGDDDEEDDPFVHRLQIALGDEGLAVVRAARQRIEQDIERGDAPALAVGPAEAWGDVLVRLSTAFVR